MINAAINTVINIVQVNPADSQVREFIDQLDRYQLSMYPVESSHLDPADELASENVYFVGAYENERLVGIGAVKLMAHDCQYGEIKRVYVPEIARGKGVAIKIMDELESHLLEKGVTVARLETGIYQPEALGLYEKLGYVQRGSFGDYPLDDPLSVFMEKLFT